MGTFPPPSDSYSSIDTNRLKEAVASLKPYVIFCLFRTWSNGWTTSCRMHEKFQRPCILGCTVGRDDLSHYVCCRRFWKALKTGLEKVSLPVPAPLVSASVFEKLALASPTADRVLHLCSVTHAYHVLKHKYRHLFHTYIAQGDTPQVANITIDVLQSAILRFHSMI